MKSLGALEYHRGTVHPGGELLKPSHRFDPMRRPPRVKEYRGGDWIGLPHAEPSDSVPALPAIKRQVELKSSAPFDLERLARLLHFSAGVTKRLDRPPLGKIPFRAASCTGALYHIELYLAWSGSADLSAGLYHYHPEDHGLLRLRAGDPGPKLAEAVPLMRNQNAVGILIFTSDYWRNATKYQARAYRHAFWDAGTILANSISMCESFGWARTLSLAYIDDRMSELLALGERPELPLFLLGLEGHKPVSTRSELGEVSVEPAPIGDFEADWPAIEAVHRSGSLANMANARAWSQAKVTTSDGSAPDGLNSLIAVEDYVLPVTDPIEAVIQRRGSSRSFRLNSISKEELSILLGSVKDPVQADTIEAEMGDLFLIINSVEGISPGGYLYQPSEGNLLQLAAGKFRAEAEQLALGQSLAGQAALNMYWLADLEAVIGSLGDRGYRLAQLQAAEAAGRGYLAAYALGLGATGLTFFDEAVIEFFAPASRGMDVMFLLAVGVPG